MGEFFWITYCGKEGYLIVWFFEVVVILERGSCGLGFDCGRCIALEVEAITGSSAFD